MSPILASFAVGVFFLVWCDWLTRVVLEPEVCGDRWYMRQFAFTSGPVSEPYCWRPLLPWLARVFGFRFVSYTASLATPPLIAWWIGGWNGFALAVAFCGNLHLMKFNVRRPEYTEGLGQLLMIGSVIALGSGHWSAWPLFLLSALCRETLTFALGAMALFVNPWLLAPLAAGTIISRIARSKNTDNRHPLVGKSAYETVKHVAAIKKTEAISFWHVIQPLRGFAFAVPFVWGGVDHFTRLGLVGCAAIWIAAYPASGQSRIIAYQFAFLAPFVGALSPEWCWTLCLFSVFWPIERYQFDETGGNTFQYYGKPSMQPMLTTTDPQDSGREHGSDDV
jgi:hypothetical protein